MVNYNQGKIYKLINEELKLIYIGSTCCDNLKTRYDCHRTKARLECVTSHRLFKTGKCSIMLLENCVCLSKKDLFNRERHWIELSKLDLDYMCVNSNIPNRSKKEYYLDKREHILNYQNNNKEQIKLTKQLYYIKNRELLKNKQKLYNYKKKHGITL